MMKESVEGLAKAQQHPDSNMAHTTDGTSVTMTPFSLAADSVYSDKFDDEETSTDGIDIVTAVPTPGNCFEWSSLSSGRIVRSRIFRRAILVCILINSILMGLATMDWVREDDHLSSVVNTIIRGFRLLSTVEIFLDICHYQYKAFYMEWILFDVGVLTLSWFVSISVLVMRSFRLVRALRKATAYAELNHLVEALLRALPKMLGVIFLIGLIFYIFAVMFTDLYQDLYDVNELSQNYFGRLDRTFFTLFQIMTLDGWSDIAKDVMEVHPWSVALFTIFIVITSFFFATLVISVMGEAFTSVTNERILKALEIDHLSAEKTSTTQHQDLTRLESRINELNNRIDSILVAQQAIQKSLKQLAEINEL